MTTPDLERQLAAVLQRHAEDAMNRTDTRARLNSLITDREQDLRRRRRLTWGAGALVAAAAIIAVIVSSLGLGFNRDQTVGPQRGRTRRRSRTLSSTPTRPRTVR